MGGARPCHLYMRYQPTRGFNFLDIREMVPYLLFIPTDQVTGENINNNATLYWAKLVQPCVQTGTPWATVFGNHGELTS